MRYIKDFLEQKDIKKSKIFKELNCKEDSAKILKELLKSYLDGKEELPVNEVLKIFNEADKYLRLSYLSNIKELLDLDWINKDSFKEDIADESLNINLLNLNISLSNSFLSLFEKANLKIKSNEYKPYKDNLEYMQEQFLRIDIYDRISKSRNNNLDMNLKSLKNRLSQLENTIQKRLKKTKIDIPLAKFISSKKLEDKEQIIFFALLKEEYSSTESNFKDLNFLMDLISVNDYEKIKHRSLLEDNSTLISSGIIDYEEVLNPFGGISKTFYIIEDVLKKIVYPKKKKRVQKLKLKSLIKEQDIFELIKPKENLNDVVLNPATELTLNNLLKFVDKNIIIRLKKWGIEDKNLGINAKIIFYGSPGTGKTLTAHSLAKSFKKKILNFDCSKILSMYVGESEKNVRAIFDNYQDICKKTQTEPILLLNEADQFLSQRGQVTNGVDQMHNQMQNIFLERLENFKGILIATTNFLDNIDKAFSRRFNYKIEFKRPSKEQRFKIWQKLLPKNAKYEEAFDIEKLIEYDLTGGQINLVIKNTAYNIATEKNPIFKMKSFLEEIKKEINANFDKNKSMGFLSL